MRSHWLGVSVLLLWGTAAGGLAAQTSRHSLFEARFEAGVSRAGAAWRPVVGYALNVGRGSFGVELGLRRYDLLEVPVQVTCHPSVRCDHLPNDRTSGVRSLAIRLSQRVRVAGITGTVQVGPGVAFVARPTLAAVDVHSSGEVRRGAVDLGASRDVKAFAVEGAIVVQLARRVGLGLTWHRVLDGPQGGWSIGPGLTLGL